MADAILSKIEGKKSEIESLTIRAEQLTRSVNFWNRWMLWSLVAAAVAALFIVLTTRMVIFRSRQLTMVQDLLGTAENRQAAEDSKDKDQKIAEAHKAAGEANERAGKAQASLAAAEQHSAEANAKAEGFRADIAKANEAAKDAEARAAEANLELARFRAPRTLSAAQQSRIANSLRAFGPQKVDIIIIGDSPEISNITELIGATMLQAGWVPRFVGKAISGPNVSGVLVGTHIGSTADVIKAAETLIASLSSAGITTTRAMPQYNDELPMALMGSWDSKNVAPIRMYVSTKL